MDDLVCFQPSLLVVTQKLSAYKFPSNPLALLFTYLLGYSPHFENAKNLICILVVTQGNSLIVYFNAC